MPLHIELSLGSGQWKPLGPITRKGWCELNHELPKSLSADYVKDTTCLVIRLLENGKPIDKIQRNLK
jgi:hypothetical protein